MHALSVTFRLPLPKHSAAWYMRFWMLSIGACQANPGIASFSFTLPRSSGCKVLNIRKREKGTGLCKSSKRTERSVSSWKWNSVNKGHFAHPSSACLYDACAPALFFTARIPSYSISRTIFLLVSFFFSLLTACSRPPAPSNMCN